TNPVPHPFDALPHIGLFRELLRRPIQSHRAMVRRDLAQKMIDTGGIDRLGEQHTEMIAALAIALRQERVEAERYQLAIPPEGGKPVALGSMRIVAVLVDVESAALALVVGVGSVQAGDVSWPRSLIVPDQMSAGQLTVTC